MRACTAKIQYDVEQFCGGGWGGCGGDLVDLHDFGCEVYINLGVQNLDEFWLKGNKEVTKITKSEAEILKFNLKRHLASTTSKGLTEN